MVFCDECGHDNEAGALTCAGCGGELLQTIFCEMCGVPNSELNEVCSGCGEELLHPDDEVVEDEVLFDLERLRFLTDEELEALQYAVTEELSMRELGDDSSLDEDTSEGRSEQLTLTLLLGESKKTVTFELLVGIITLDSFVEDFGFAPESIKHLEIHGLQVPNGPRVMFQASKLFPFPHIEVKGRLKDGMTLRVLYTDAREVSVKQLTPAELKKLQKEFRRLDHNGDGSVSEAEVREFFTKMQSKAKASSASSFSKRMAAFRDKKSGSSLSTQMSKHVENEQLRVDKLVAQVMSYDVDGDGSVALDEFVAGRAAAVVAERVNK